MGALSVAVLAGELAAHASIAPAILLTDRAAAWRDRASGQSLSPRPAILVNRRFR
jgi:hypothetical protein